MAAIEFKLPRLPGLVVRADYEPDDEQESVRLAADVRWTLGEWSVHCGAEDVSDLFDSDGNGEPTASLMDLIDAEVTRDIELSMRLSVDDEQEADSWMYSLRAA